MLDAATRLFASQGYANTSSAEIALAAGVSEGTIFKHYGTKDRLLLAILQPFLGELFQQMTKEVVRESFSNRTLTLEQFLRNFIANRARFLAENRHVFRVLVKEMMYNDELRDAVKAYAARHIPPALNLIVNQFKGKGEMADLPAETVLNLAATYLGGFFVSRFVFMDRDDISDEEIEEAVRFLMGGIGNRGAS